MLIAVGRQRRYSIPSPLHHHHIISIFILPLTLQLGRAHCLHSEPRTSRNLKPHSNIKPGYSSTFTAQDQRRKSSIKAMLLQSTQDPKSCFADPYHISISLLTSYPPAFKIIKFGVGRCALRDGADVRRMLLTNRLGCHVGLAVGLVYKDLGTLVHQGQIQDN